MEKERETHTTEIHTLHKGFQNFDLIRSRDKVTQQLLVELRSGFKEVGETRGIFRDDSVFFEELNADFGFEVESRCSLEKDLLVCFRAGYILCESGRQVWVRGLQDRKNESQLKLHCYGKGPVETHLVESSSHLTDQFEERFETEELERILLIRRSVAGWINTLFSRRGRVSFKS